jgi:predicted NBD/HSP70 family sugar kinase
MNITGDATFLRKVNESALLELIREHGPITRTDLARRLGLSLPTVTRIVNALIASKRVLECSFADSHGGRRPTLLQFNFRSGLVISVYIGKKMWAALADLQGEVLQRRKLDSLRGEASVQQLIGVIEDLRREAQKLDIPVLGVGLGVPSTIISPQGIVTWAAVLEWRELPLKERLEAATGLPVVVENEVNLITLGEMWRGEARGVRNLVCLTLDWGIGAGLVLDGHLYRGSHGAAGEVGYLIPNEACLGRSYKAFGCLESLAGGDRILQQVMEGVDGGKVSRLSAQVMQDRDNLTLEMVLEAARLGDPLACQAVNGTVEYLSIAVANLICIVDPDRIVLSGGLGEFGDLFAGPIREKIADAIPTEYLPEIIPSSLKLDAAVYGAIASVLRLTEGAIKVEPSRA